MSCKSLQNQALVAAGPGVGTLFFTGSNPDGYGLDVSAGTANINAGLSVDHSGNVSGGSVVVAPDAKLTLGLAAASTPSLQTGGFIGLQGTLIAHGGIYLFGGTLSTDGQSGTITVDAANQVWLAGGEIDVVLNGLAPAILPNTQGKLTINGNFYALGGTIVNNVNSAAALGPSGTLLVNGNVFFTPWATMSSRDLNPHGPQNATNYTLVQWTGTETGTLTVSLPDGWSATWDTMNGELWDTEPARTQ